MKQWHIEIFVFSQVGMWMDIIHWIMGDRWFSLVMASCIVCPHKFSCHSVFVSIFFIIYEIQPFFPFIWRYNQITLKCISFHTRKTNNINMANSLNYVQSFLQWLLCDVYIILWFKRRKKMKSNSALWSMLRRNTQIPIETTQLTIHCCFKQLTIRITTGCLRWFRKHLIETSLQCY